MNSKKAKKPASSSSLSLPPQKRPPYKFLQRTLKIGNQDPFTYDNFHVKRFHIKKLIDPQEYSLYEIDYKFISRLFKTTKLTKTLQQAQVSSFLEPYVHENLKNLKQLKKYTFCFDASRNPTKGLLWYFKKLPPKVQEIRFHKSGFTSISAIDLCHLTKYIRRFHKLQHFKRRYFSWSFKEKEFLPKEIQICNQSGLRLQKMKGMTYSANGDETTNLIAAMKKGNVYPGINELRVEIIMYNLGYYSQMRPFFEEEKFDDEDYDDYVYRISNNFTVSTQQVLPNNLSVEEDNSSVGSLSFDDSRPEEEHQAYCRMRKELKPFYSYELFPNLKKLDIRQQSYLYPLGSFVIEGFKALKNLESLKIAIRQRSIDTIYLFMAFLELPLLRNFSLRINFLRVEDWPVFEKFVKTQANLQSFVFELFGVPDEKDRYLQLNASLEKLIQCLEDKPMLKDLSLKSQYWSLEALSKGLSHLTMKNQLYSFTFEGIDEMVTSKTKPAAKVSGLCKFIKNQKDSLRELNVLLPLVLKDKIAVQITEAISKLVNLRDLRLELNFCTGMTQTALYEFFEGALEADFWENGCVDEWGPNIAKHLQRLENLESLQLKCDILNEGEEGVKWFVDIVKALPSLERLKKLEILSYEEERLEGQEDEMVEALLRLKNVKDIAISLWKDKGEETSSHDEIQPILYEIRERQALRHDLLF